ncbi:PEP-CTERM sorting domain-containing protein [Crocosphaera sp. Alani8]|uniref:PEP-CTERM sorting domain-containing protein n=1 Tax=Crocosphaera sp. Alani8 TaxID=3038952 RepID=UPI00313B2856
MEHQKICYSLSSKSLSNLTITAVTALGLVIGLSAEARAAVIDLDADVYAYSNENTCNPLLPDTGGKCFVEDGFNVEAFSAQGIGTEDAFFSEGSHFHARGSYEAQHYSDVDRLLGIYLTLVDGGTFSLESLDYQLRDNTRAISGYSTDDTKILISTTFDPTQPVSGQFVEYSLGSDLPSMFETLDITGFENITQVYISSSGDVNFDNITTSEIPEGADPNSVPEPGTLLGLLTLGTMGFVSRVKGKSKISK